ncbi:unnamed protein product [Linum trigynum]|uniref:Uncharacterized protein n=1 Tax=Linum trigynum TaxID=586398 RepID=A0AAV2DJY2_9ROSI
MAVATPVPNLFRLILTAVLCSGFYFVGFYQNFRGTVSLPSPPSPAEDLLDHDENSTSCDFPTLFPPLDFLAHHFLPETPAPAAEETVHISPRMKSNHRRAGGPYAAAEEEDGKAKKNPS